MFEYRSKLKWYNDDAILSNYTDVGLFILTNKLTTKWIVVIKNDQLIIENLYLKSFERSFAFSGVDSISILIKYI